MNILILYSSKTGNTRQIAEAIQHTLPDADLCSVEERPEIAKYDLIFFGFWVDKGTADTAAQTMVAELHDKRIALFATLGAYPDSQHATESLDRVAKLIPNGEIIDRFICQGAIDPKLIEWMKSLPDNHPHGPDDARRKRWSDASTHPDHRDVEAAKKWALKVYKRIENESAI